MMLNLLTRSATGQKMTAYISLITGPRRPDDLDGPEELHMIVLDNGRSKQLGTRYQAVLHCIRCAACLNVCPVYRHIGGHTYGSVYSGPIGAVLSPLLGGFEKHGEPPTPPVCAAPARKRVPSAFPFTTCCWNSGGIRWKRGAAGGLSRWFFADSPGSPKIRDGLPRRHAWGIG